MTERIEEQAPVDEYEQLRQRQMLEQARAAAVARTRQLVEWLGFALIVFAVELLFGVGWGVLAAGVALVVASNAS